MWFCDVWIAKLRITMLHNVMFSYVGIDECIKIGDKGSDIGRVLRFIVLDLV